MNNNFDMLFSDMKKVSETVEKYIKGTFAESDEDIDEVADAMRYSLFAGGKRIRP